MNKIFLAVVVASLLFLSLFASATAMEDISAPIIAEISFTPEFVDTSDSDQIITVTARITDDLSGMNRATILFFPEKTGFKSQMGFVSLDAENRIAGDALDGIYQNTFILPKFSAQGRWKIFEVNAYDLLSNYQVNRINCQWWPWMCLNSAVDKEFYNGYVPTKIFMPIIGGK